MLENDDDRLKLIAIYLVARRIGIPTPCDLQIELVNSGVRNEHLREAAKLNDLIEFVMSCLLTSEEELEEMELSPETHKNIVAIKELLTPDTELAIEEEMEYSKDG